MTSSPARPRVLLLVRHGESVGNVAATAAERAGAPTVDVGTRDADTPLSDLGLAQARALGDALGALGAAVRPDVVWCSPYARALATARTALDAAGLTPDLRVDERLRDRELGILDGLTRHGVRTRHPDEAERRRRLGKMYHRPPGGESWADVALRLRAALGDLGARDAGRSVLLVAHDAVVALARYVLQDLDEEQLMDVVRDGSVRNASLSRFDHDGEAWHLRTWDDVDHLTDVRVTEHDGTGDGRA
ncbi:histidine phosphatase family protein [Cellulomonas oligotrophica]|uniref:Broad specificity phosphatase PhoE n=1 Tax=Cellulomonas oligotrophica TaxID=931536 RepID=A0A7Y9FIK7_9CELL|nr:histidine phosphatase family protein [Cellulomonas oligotrophica]NYD87899.1 broad specificity phosphatase PhoE [Cellulomonas oligotrophica]GIG32894.1 phosphoglycerate mutase [Cellulomonas oligotrophica]